MHLHSDRFSVETEMTVKVAKLGARIYELPIVYHGRTYADGKKISWHDGWKALYDLIRYRFTEYVMSLLWSLRLRKLLNCGGIRCRGKIAADAARLPGKDSQDAQSGDQR